MFVVDELVVALGGQVEGAGDYAKRGEDQDGPRGGDKVEAGVKVPAVPEAGVVVVEEGLGVLVVVWDVEYAGKHTTIAMPAHCTTALKTRTPDATCQPAARLCTPPPTMTMKETRVQSSMTTAKEIKKPTVRHILQKDGSLTQSDSLGNGTQVLSSAEQRLWRP